MLDEAGAPIYLLTDKLKCDERGTLYSVQGDFLGRIGVFSFGEDAAPAKDASGLFQADVEAQLNDNVRVHNGMLERSNVDWLQQMTKMISAQRAYQSAASLSKMYDEVMNHAASNIGRM